MTRLPPRAGVGFKPDHFAAIRRQPGAVAFFEVHAENYMGAGGPPQAQLAALRADVPISLHGVGLSIGGAGDLDRICDHVDQVQEALGRRMLLENPATYVLFAESSIPETGFLAEVARRTGCGLLLDVNNVFVSCTNHRTDPRAYLRDFPMQAVGEIHLGGHKAEEMPSGPLLIDSHGAPVADPVWTLFAEVIDRIGPMPTLIEWDNDLPDWPVLAAEAARAEAILTRVPAHA